MSKQGKVKFFNQEKGYGFIIEENNGEEYFVHISGVNGDTLNEDDDVTFNLVEGKKGLNAVDVTLL